MCRGLGVRFVVIMQVTLKASGRVSLRFTLRATMKAAVL